MIIYYDIMLLEDQSLINLRHSERFKILSSLVCCRKGWAELVPRHVVDFGQALGASTLRKIFAMTILARKEGLVLKPDEPYFDFTNQHRRFSSCCIKLKKEYIGNFGDVGDFAVVGAKYDSTKALTYRIPGLKWSHFYIGCLDNREVVKRWNAKPEFTIVNVVELNETMLREVLMYSNPGPVAPGDNDALIFKLAPGVEQGSPPTVIFTRPLVFDLKCFSFDRVGNTGFWSLRFPSVTKVHFDRDFTDTMSFEQLQALAEDATTAIELEDSQENLEWIARLEAADPRGIAVDAVSQLTVTTMSTPSPRKLTQNTTSTWSPTSPLRTRPSVSHRHIPYHETSGSARPLILPTIVVGTAADSVQAALSPTSAALVPQTKHKRDPPSLVSESSRKRQKPNTDSSQKQNKHSYKRRNNSQSRKPLGDIDDNSQSQSAMTSYAAEVVIDEDHDISEEPVMDPDTIVFAEPELETEPELLHVKPHTVDVEILAKKGCAFASVKCRLYKAVVLVSPGLLDRHEAETLLELHGVDDPVTNVDAWLEAEKAGSHQGAALKASKVYFLCESDQHTELEPLIAKIKDIHNNPHSEKYSSIEVYDWRFLKYLTIEEDSSIEDKYYDGFRHSWQRWYIGSV
jgi:DNA ligase-4